jgi:dipeptidyl aminopeptidase/acylaminoacyl peptidase
MRARWLIGFLFIFPLFGQAKRPFTFEDMMALKRVGEPLVSPNGKWVLFAAVDVNLSANTKTPHVWVVPLNGGEQAGKTGSSSPSVAGMTEMKEREMISDQDADRPRWAPDGKRFAFVSTKDEGSQIWIADFDDATGTVTAKHRLTSILTEADGELWSPDGKYILFKSDVYPECKGSPAEEAACNAKKLADAKESKVKAQIFTHLLYRHWNAYKEGKRTHLFVVPADSCGRADVGHQGPDVPAGPGEHGSQAAEQRPAGQQRARAPVLAEDGLGLCTIARDLTPGDWDAPVFSLGGQDNYALSPDGRELCYASNREAMPAASTNNDLLTVPLNWPADATSAEVLAATKNITAENRAADNTPLYSPNGNYIAYRAQARPGYESDRWRLMVYVRKIGVENSPLKFEFDRSIGTMAWSLDSKHIYFSSEQHGGSPIYESELAWTDAGLAGSGPREVVSGFNDDLALTRAGDALIFTRMSVSSPNEIYSAKAGTPCTPENTNQPAPRYEVPDCMLRKATALTHLNDSVLSQVSMSTLESFWFSGANNDQVQGFLVKPPNFDSNKNYPVKFLIHGGPEGAWGDDWSYRWNPELFAANGYVVLMINFHGSTGYGQKFTDAINGDWGGAPFEDLMMGLDYAEKHYAYIDQDRECALGASYGGYMANWILGHTNRFKCIVSHDGIFNAESAYGDTEELWFPEWEFKGTPWTNREMYRKWSPHLSATNFKTPTLVVHGQLDYRLDVSQGFDLFTTLQRQGVPSKMLYFPDEGHWVLKPQNSQLWYETVNAWVDQWIENRK